MAEVPETKLVKVLIIALTEKKIHWWRDIVLVKHLLFIEEKQLCYKKTNFSKLFGTGIKEKTQANKILFCF